MLERRDLAAADLIALTQQVSAIDVELAALGRTDAEQRRRLETNRLTLSWRSDALVEDEDDDGFFAGLWTTFADSLEEGLDGAAEYAGYLLPVLLLAFPMALLWRFAWRRATGAHRR